MDDLGYLWFGQRAAEKRTARLEVRREKDRFVATGKYVRQFRLLLDESMLGDGGDVRVSFNGTEYKRRPRRSAKILLTEFVERFDRTFLPVAEVRIP